MYSVLFQFESDSLPYIEFVNFHSIELISDKETTDIGRNYKNVAICWSCFDCYDKINWDDLCMFVVQTFPKEAVYCNLNYSEWTLYVFAHSLKWKTHQSSLPFWNNIVICRIFLYLTEERSVYFMFLFIVCKYCTYWCFFLIRTPPEEFALDFGFRDYKKSSVK